MNNYYRITAYHPETDISVILDSYGRLEKLWQFSAFLVARKFKIVAVDKSENISFGNIAKANYDDKNIIIRAYRKGEISIIRGVIHLGDKQYTPNINNR